MQGNLAFLKLRSLRTQGRRILIKSSETFYSCSTKNMIMELTSSRFSMDREEKLKTIRRLNMTLYRE